VTFRLAPNAVAGTNTPLSWISAGLNDDTMPCTSQGEMVAIGSSSTKFAAPQNVYAAHGSQLAIPIVATGLTGGSSFDFIVTFDPTVLSAVSVQKGTLTSCMTMYSNLMVPGIARITMFGLCNVSGSGPVVTVLFDIVGANGSRTPINITRGSIDEEHLLSVLQDGLFNVCGVPDADGDGYSSCAGDCNDGNAGVHPGTLEICNGIDDDCNGGVDDAVMATPIVGLVLTQDDGDTRLAWPVTSGATGYDVVQGDLGALRFSGSFSNSTDTCLADNAPESTLLDLSIPADDQGFWYLVRPVNCGGSGSFDGAGSDQAGPRDPGINAAPQSCP
jgi:hypothetical protein